MRFLPSQIWHCITTPISFAFRVVLHSTAVTAELCRGLIPLPYNLVSAVSRVHWKRTIKSPLFLKWLPLTGKIGSQYSKKEFGTLMSSIINLILFLLLELLQPGPMATSSDLVKHHLTRMCHCFRTQSTTEIPESPGQGSAGSGLVWTFSPHLEFE